jgi:hypothetical protein
VRIVGLEVGKVRSQEVVEVFAEYDEVRLPRKDIELEQNQKMRSSIGGEAYIDDFDRVPSEALAEHPLEHARIVTAVVAIRGEVLGRRTSDTNDAEGSDWLLKGVQFAVARGYVTHTLLLPVEDWTEGAEGDQGVWAALRFRASPFREECSSRQHVTGPDAQLRY